MSLDILLLIATIVVAVIAVFASLLQAVFERRSTGSAWTGQAPRKVGARRLARAVPPPARVEGRARPRIEVSVAEPVESAPEPVEPAAPFAVEPQAPSLLEASVPEPVEPAAPIPVMDPSIAVAPEPRLPTPRETVLVTPPPVPAQGAAIEVDAAAATEVETAATAATEVDDAVAAAASPAPSAPPEREPASVAAASLSIVSATAPAAWIPDEPETPDLPIEDELAYRIGVSGARRPARPAVIVVAGAEPRTVPFPGTVATEAWPKPPHRRRRAAFRVAAAAAALAWIMTAVVVLPDLTQQGGVLGETGRPRPSGDPGLVGPQTPATTPTSTAVTPEPSPSPDATASPSASPTTSSAPASSSASTGGVEVAVASPRSGGTTSAPGAAATPTARPSRAPRPSRVPLPKAAFICTTTALTLSCAATVTEPAASYTWDFSEGNTVSGAQASHLFATPGQYLVMLTVTNAWGSSSSSTPFKIG